MFSVYWYTSKSKKWNILRWNPKTFQPECKVLQKQWLQLVSPDNWKRSKLKAQRHKLLSASRLSIKSLLLFLYSSKRSKRKLSIIMASSLTELLKAQKVVYQKRFSTSTTWLRWFCQRGWTKKKAHPKENKNEMFYLLTICSPLLFLNTVMSSWLFLDYFTLMLRIVER